MRRLLLAVSLATAVALACSDEPRRPIEDGADAGPDASQAHADACTGCAPDTGAPEPDGGPDVGFLLGAEVESNDTAATANRVAVPGGLTGAVNPGDDFDALALDLTAGSLLTYELKATTLELAPYLVVQGDQSVAATKAVPYMVAKANAGGTATQEHYVFATGRYFAVVGDRRNVPAGSSQHVGSPDFAWELKVKTTPRAPIPLGWGTKVSDTLAGPTAIGVFSFQATAGQKFRLDVYAKRLGAPSDVDTRLTLFNATTKQYIATNQDEPGGTTDSLLQGQIPSSGEIVAVVENVAPAPANLAYEVELVSQ